MSKKVVAPPIKWELGRLPLSAKKGEYLLELCLDDGETYFDVCRLRFNSIDCSGSINEDDIVAYAFLDSSYNSLLTS